MAGRIIREGHVCSPPSTSCAAGTVWQCDCGRYKAMTTEGRWVGISSLELAALRFVDGMAAAQRDAAAERVALKKKES